MKRLVSVLVIFAVLVGSTQFTLMAAQSSGEISGTAVVEGKPLANVTVRLRSVDNGQLVGNTTTTARGEFRFTSLPAGNYVVETVTPNGTLLGTSARIALTGGAMIAGSVAVSTSAAAAAAAGAGVGAGAAAASAGAAAGGAAAAGAGAAAGAAAATGGFFASTLGAVTVAAAAAGVTTAAVAARNDASPSR
jgi:hypothetical protein